MTTTPIETLADYTDANGVLDMDKLYRDSYENICNAIGKFIKQYGGDFEDHLSRSNIRFIQSVDAFDASHGRRFDRWIYMRIYCNLLDGKRVDLQRNTRLPRSTGHDLTKIQATQAFDLASMRRLASPDASMVLKLVTTNTETVGRVIKQQRIETNPTKYKRDMVRLAIARELCVEWEWELDRVHRAFEEVSELLVESVE